MRLDLRFSVVLGLVIASLVGCGSPDTPEDTDDDETDERSGSAKGDDDDDDDDDDDAQETKKDAGTKRDAGSTSSRPLDAGRTPDAGSADAKPSSSGGDSSTADAGKTVDVGGSAPTGDFLPCPTNGDPCKILPLGDSITVGLSDPSGGGYRLELFKKALADGKKITFLGSQMGGPAMVDGATFPRNHEGYSGWTISQINGLVPNPAFREIPHIVLLMAGTNDVVWAGPEGAPMRLGTLIDAVIKAAPDALLVVAQLTPLGDPASDGRAKTYNETIPATVEMRASAGKHVIMVDMHSGVPASGISTDTVHPNPQGYKAMADVWYEAVGPVLP